jgi:hypothetical protein
MGGGGPNSDDGRKSLALSLFTLRGALYSMQEQSKSVLYTYCTVPNPKMVSTSSMYVTYTVLLSDTLCIHNEINITYHYLHYSVVRTECTYVHCTVL